jgi:ketosteroid isomerase-like protein
MGDAEIRKANRALLERALELLSAGDVDAHNELCTDDILFELPYGSPPGRIEGREPVRAYLKGALAIFSMRLWVTGVFDTDDPNVLVAEYASEGRVTTTGKDYANTYIGVYQFRDGCMCGVREYYTPVPATEALTPS